MNKVRVYELARELGVESKLLMNTLKSLGVVVATHQSMLSNEEVSKLKAALRGEASVAKPAVGQPVTGGGGNRVVIRRRKSLEDPSEEPSNETPSVTSDSVISSAAAVTSVHHTTAEQPAKKISSTTSPQAQEDRKVQSSTPAEPLFSRAPNVTRADDAAAALEKRVAARIAARSREGGATIVRRATVDEQKKIVDGNRRPQRREDSRGTTYTGVGSAPRPTEVAIPNPIDELSRSRRSKVPNKKTRDEEQAAEAKRLKGEKKDALNVRQILGEIEEDQIYIETTETEVPDAPKGRVYTPTVGAKRKDPRKRKDLRKTEVTTARASYRVVRMGAEITVAELSHQLKIKATDLIKKLMGQGIIATMNYSMDFDTTTIIAADFGYEVKNTENDLENSLEEYTSQALETASERRAPIVTVMGHVDHGKTSILDAIRNAQVASGEAGGITQHIGAYKVEHKGEEIAFLDTPGHEAFSAMRARGANVTDLVILVVAADDGVMPQTIEAISHAKAANVPLIVAINKIDKESKNLDRIYSELSEHGITSEEWGGETQFIKVSALQRTGITELLDAILLQAEVLELRTRTDIPAVGVVVEAHLDQGRGPVATVLVRHGILKKGDQIVAGTQSGRIRAMFDHHGKEVQNAMPSTPVEVLGLSGVPEAGDRTDIVADEKRCREIISFRQQQAARLMRKGGAENTLSALMSRMVASETPELALIIKGDTQGSVEAIVGSIEKLPADKVRCKVVHRAVGGISESDVNLSEATGASIFAFNVRAGRSLDDLAERKGIVIKYFSIIYELIDALKALMLGKLPPIKEEVVIGKAEVRQPISVPKIGVVAGSAVLDGRITRTASLRVIRDNIVIFTGKISSLKRFKDDVKEVKSGFECGITLESYNDVRVGDVLEAFEIQETAQVL